MLLQEVEPEFLDYGWVIPVLEMTTIVVIMSKIVVVVVTTIVVVVATIAVVVATIAVSKSVFSRLSSSL
jgi:hypothetical protein